MQTIYYTITATKKDGHYRHLKTLTLEDAKMLRNMWQEDGFEVVLTKVITETIPL